MLILIGAVPERLVHGHQSRLLFPTSLAPPGPAIGFSTATLIQGTPCQTTISEYLGVGAAPSAKDLTNIKFIQKEEFYSQQVNNEDSKTKVQIKGQILTPPHGSNLCIFKKIWRRITQNKSVLDIVKGFKIPFVQKPTQTYHPQTYPTDPEEDLLISSKISHLLEKGAVEEVDISQLHYSNCLFLVAKHSWGKASYKSPTFTRFIPNQTFKMENILKPVIALLHTRGISIIFYLDDLLIVTGTYMDCLDHTK